MLYILGVFINVFMKGMCTSVSAPYANERHKFYDLCCYLCGVVRPACIGITDECKR